MWGMAMIDKQVQIVNIISTVDLNILKANEANYSNYYILLFLALNEYE